MSHLAQGRRRRETGPARALITTGLALSLLVAAASAGPTAAAGPAPATLQETGLYADAAALQVDPRHLEFSPQYPLWTDGAAKRRWISLPAGAAIDASDPDAWVFPVGTRFWKEFSFGGRRVETRYIERQPDGRWLYAAYAWSDDGRQTQLVREGRRNAYPLGGGRFHAIPRVSDCKACHEGGRTPVLGFGALQLSPDRDAGAPHAEPLPPSAVDLVRLVQHGLVVGLPPALLQKAPRIAAASPTERSALGYLHGNCGHCHNAQGSLRNVGLFLRQDVRSIDQPAIASTVGHSVANRAPGQSADAVLRIDPRHPDRSALMQRIGSRYAPLQMPPLGTALVDHDSVALIRSWIADTLRPSHPQPGD